VSLAARGIVALGAILGRVVIPFRCLTHDTEKRTRTECRQAPRQKQLQHYWLGGESLWNSWNSRNGWNGWNTASIEHAAGCHLVSSHRCSSNLPSSSLLSSCPYRTTSQFQSLTNYHTLFYSYRCAIPSPTMFSQWPSLLVASLSATAVAAALTFTSEPSTVCVGDSATWSWDNSNVLYSGGYMV
jgi:hypothetical protein